MFQESKKPNFFIVGAAKSGTTSLYQYLKNHADIYLSQIKEPNYFSTDIQVDEFCETYKKNTFLDLDSYFGNKTLPELQLSFVRDETQYQALFDNVRHEKAIGECSTSYLFSKDAAQKIFDFNRDSRIIVMLRNPVKRAFSHYLMALRYGYTHLDFRAALEKDRSIKKKGWGKSELYVELGLYANQLQRYYDLFPEEQIKVFLFEDFVSAPQSIVDECCDFLGIKRITLKKFEQFNKALTPKNARINSFLVKSGLKNLVAKAVSPEFKNSLKKIMYNNSTKILSNEDEQFLNELYREDIRQTAALTGKNLKVWQ